MNTTNNNDDLLNDDPEQSSRRNITKSDDMPDYELEDPDDILNDDVDDFIDEDMDYSDSNSPYDENDADAVFDRQEKDKKRSNIIRRIILLISVAVFIFAAYNLINIFLAYHKADVIYNDIEQNVLDEDSHTNVIIGDEEEEVEVPFKYIRHFLILILMDLDIYTFHLLDAGFQWFRVMIMIITLHIHLTSNPVLMAVCLKIPALIADFLQTM